MTDIPKIFDSNIAYQHRLRDDAMFLHDLVADEFHQRLEEVNRTFTKIAVVTPFTSKWKTLFPNADIIAQDYVLGFPNADYDLVIHAMGLHRENDPVGQIIQCRNALKADGMFLAACFGGQTLVELGSALAQAEIKLKGGMSPRVHPMAEIRDLAGLLQRSGLALPVADSLIQNVSHGSLLALLHDLRHMGETNKLTQRPKGFAPKALFTEAAEILGTNAPIQSTFEILFLNGWVPHESQQKPMRPASASFHLTEVLEKLNDEKDN